MGGFTDTIIIGTGQAGLTYEEIAFLLSADVAAVHQICNFEHPDGLELITVEAMADRMAGISAHDRLRLAAFRAKTEQIPGNPTSAAAAHDV